MPQVTGFNTLKNSHYWALDKMVKKKKKKSEKEKEKEKENL
jgi:hypothetical protein